MKKSAILVCLVTLAACRGGTDSGTISSSSTSTGSGGTGSSSGGATGSGGTSSGGSFECPAVGDKLCPNDDPVTQSAVDICERCNAQYSAYFACVGGPECGPDGTTASSSKPECKTQQDAVVECALSDGGR